MPDDRIRPIDDLTDNNCEHNNPKPVVLDSLAYLPMANRCKRTKQPAHSTAAANIVMQKSMDVPLEPPYPDADLIDNKKRRRYDDRRANQQHYDMESKFFQLDCFYHFRLMQTPDSISSSLICLMVYSPVCIMLATIAASAMPSVNTSTRC